MIFIIRVADALSAVVPVAIGVLRHGGSRAPAGRCQPPAPHRLLPPGAVAPIAATVGRKIWERQGENRSGK